MMSNTLCLVMDYRDAGWLAEQVRHGDHDRVVVAPTFEGRRVAERLGIPFVTYQEESWAIDRCRMGDLARQKARCWIELPSLQEFPSLESFRDFKGYPLLVMHQSLLYLALYEILQARALTLQIMKRERPSRLLYGQRDNPFAKEILYLTTGSHGVEREVARSFHEKGVIGGQTAPTFIEDNLLQAQMAKSEPLNRTAFQKSQEKDGPRILVFSYGLYYLEYCTRLFDILLAAGARIVVVVIGGEIDRNVTQGWEEKGVRFLPKASWQMPNETSIIQEWVRRAREAVKAVYANEDLVRYFSDEDGSYYMGLVNDAIGRQILTMPDTVLEILRSTAILRAFEPDVVINHFSLHPKETCDVLPARLAGIPTLSFDHGVNGYTDTQRYTFASEYYAVSGGSFKEALGEALGGPTEKIEVIGNLRYDRLSPLRDRAEAKRQFGFDPQKPLCIFCDSSGCSHMNENRHSTAKLVDEILKLQRQISGLQIVYRVHHGCDDEGAIKAYLEFLKRPGVHYQTSLGSLLLDVVQAADVVVSQYTSAVAESLLRGVPVVYLTALGETEPSYLCCEAIRVAGSFEQLPVQVRSFLEQEFSRETVRRMAQPYFDIALAGADGRASERMADLVLRLASLPKKKRVTGFQDWLDRIEASCRFDSKTWRKRVPSAGMTEGRKTCREPPEVPVIG